MHSSSVPLILTLPNNNKVEIDLKISLLSDPNYIAEIQKKLDLSKSDAIQFEQLLFSLIKEHKLNSKVKQLQESTTKRLYEDACEHIKQREIQLIKYKKASKRVSSPIVKINNKNVNTGKFKNVKLFTKGQSKVIRVLELLKREDNWRRLNDFSFDSSYSSPTKLKRSRTRSKTQVHNAKKIPNKKLRKDDFSLRTGQETSNRISAKRASSSKSFKKINLSFVNLHRDTRRKNTQAVKHDDKLKFKLDFRGIHGRIETIKENKNVLTNYKMDSKSKMESENLYVNRHLKNKQRQQKKKVLRQETKLTSLKQMSIFKETDDLDKYVRRYERHNKERKID